MKKLISLLLCLCLVLSGTACAQAAQPAANKGSQSDSPQDQTAHASESAEKLRNFSREGTIEETVLYDENNVKITAKNLIYNNYAAEISLVLENNSQQPLTFLSQTNNYSRNTINGCMAPGGYLNCDIEPGKKSMETLHFDYDNLRMWGIFDISQLQLGFQIQDDEYNVVASTGIIDLPTSLSGSSHEAPVSFFESFTGQAAANHFGYQVLQASEECLYEEGGLKILSSAIAVKDRNQAVFLEVQNSSDAVIHAGIVNIAVNGLLLSSHGYSAEAVNPGARAVVPIRLYDLTDPETAELFGIDQISSVSFDLIPMDEDANEVASTRTITLTVPDSKAALKREGQEIYNGNGLRLISKGILEDPLEYSDDVHVLLLAENQSDHYLTLDDVYDSLSVNSFMTDCLFYSIEIGPGQSALLDVELQGYSLKKNDLTAADITEVELSMEISQGHSTLDTPTLKMSFSK